MNIEHHPTDSLLAAFAAGTLDNGQHIAIATHLFSCPKCHTFVCSMEKVGGAMLEGLPAASMSNDAMAAVEARLNESIRSAPVGMIPALTETEVPGLPKFVRCYQFEKWKWVAPSVYLRRIIPPYASDTRVFLLKSGPGTKMLEHAHTGFEMTCVLSGAFSQGGAHFGPGDFDLGDQTVDHEPIVDNGQDCVCLVAMQGDLRLKGVLGRIVQPLVRL